MRCFPHHTFVEQEKIINKTCSNPFSVIGNGSSILAVSGHGDVFVYSRSRAEWNKCDHMPTEGR